MANLSGIVKRLKTERDRVRKQLFGTRNGTYSICYCLLWQHAQPSAEDERCFSGEDCGCARTALGEGQEI